MSIEDKIFRAIENEKLSLKNEGEKYWFNYKLNITFLYWSRNFHDGYQIDVYDKESEDYLDRVIYPSLNRPRCVSGVAE